MQSNCEAVDHYAANNPVRYTDPDGKYSFDGNCALAEEITEFVEKIPAPVKIAIGAKLIAATPFLAAAILLSILLRGSSTNLHPALPPGYSYEAESHVIFSPNGLVIATPDHAWKHYNGDVDWSFIDGWAEGSYDTSQDSLISHFYKHGKEVGAKSPEEYLRKAQDFKMNLRGATKRKIEGSTSNVTRYYKNNKYIDLDAEDNIISFGSVNHID